MDVEIHIRIYCGMQSIRTNTSIRVLYFGCTGQCHNIYVDRLRGRFIPGVQFIVCSTYLCRGVDNTRIARYLAYHNNVPIGMLLNDGLSAST